MLLVSPLIITTNLRQPADAVIPPPSAAPVGTLPATSTAAMLYTLIFITVNNSCNSRSLAYICSQVEVFCSRACSVVLHDVARV